MGGDTVGTDKNDKKEKHAEEGDGKEEKIKDKKKDKDKGDKEEDKKKKKKKSPEDKNDLAALKQKLEKIDAKMQAMTAKREQILKQIHEAEQGGTAAVPPQGSPLV